MWTNKDARAAIGREPFCVVHVIGVSGTAMFVCDDVSISYVLFVVQVIGVSGACIHACIMVSGACIYLCYGSDRCQGYPYKCINIQ